MKHAHHVASYACLRGPHHVYKPIVLSTHTVTYIFVSSISATLLSLIYIPFAFRVVVWAHFPEHRLVIDPITFAIKVKAL